MNSQEKEVIIVICDILIQLFEQNRWHLELLDNPQAHEEMFSVFLHLREQLRCATSRESSTHFFLAFEGKWWLCSVKYFRGNKAA